VLNQGSHLWSLAEIRGNSQCALLAHTWGRINRFGTGYTDPKVLRRDDEKVTKKSSTSATSLASI